MITQVQDYRSFVPPENNFATIKTERCAYITTHEQLFFNEKCSTQPPALDEWDLMVIKTLVLCRKLHRKWKKRVFFLTPWVSMTLKCFSGSLFVSFKPSKPATSRRELKLDGTRAEMSYLFLTVKVIKHTSSLQGSKSSTAAFQKDKLHSNWSFGLSAEVTGWTSMADYTGGQTYLFWFWAQINSTAKDAQGMLKHNN